MRNIQGIILCEHEHIGRFSNLHCVPLIYVQTFVIPVKLFVGLLDTFCIPHIVSLALALVWVSFTNHSSIS